MREAGAGEQQVRRIRMIDRSEQTPLRLCFGDIDRISVQAPVHGSGECNSVRDRQLRQLVRTCNARDPPANTRCIACHDAPRAILVSELQQPQAHMGDFLRFFAAAALTVAVITGESPGNVVGGINQCLSTSSLITHTI